MSIDALDITNGITLIILCFISIYVAIRIISKYFEYKRKEFILVDLVYIFLTSPWYPATISFIMFLIIGEILSPEVYFIIGTNLWPIALTLWIFTFTDLVYEKQQKIIVFIFICYGALFYIIFYYLLFTDPDLIGYLKGYTDVQYNNFIVVYGITLLIIMIITGYLFCRKSLESDSPEIRLKGKLLLAAFILFVAGAGLDTSVPLTFLTLPIIRGLEISSAIAFYMGFILPKWTKRLFLRKENVDNPIP